MLGFFYSVILYTVMISGFLTAELGFCSIDWALIVKLHGTVTILFVHKAIQSL